MHAFSSWLARSCFSACGENPISRGRSGGAAATPVALARVQLLARTKLWLAVKILSLVGSFYISDSGSTFSRTCVARVVFRAGRSRLVCDYRAVVSTCVRVLYIERSRDVRQQLSPVVVARSVALSATSDAAADPPSLVCVSVVCVCVCVCPLLKQVEPSLYRVAHGQDQASHELPPPTRTTRLSEKDDKRHQHHRQGTKRREGGRAM